MSKPYAMRVSGIPSGSTMPSDYISRCIIEQTVYPAA